MQDSRVLLTDGAMKHTLAAVRSLRKHGLQVTVTDDSYLAQSFYSRHCHDRILTPRGLSPEEYVRQLRSILKKEPHDALLPISWYACYYVSKYRHFLENLVSLALPDFESMEIAANKDRTLEFAKSHGINVPTTIPLKSPEDLHRATNEIGYPLVVKGSTEGGSVRYIHNFRDLERAYLQLKNDRPIAQKYIEGDGCGFYAAYDGGECVARFMHLRVREYPVNGGPSTAAKSFYSPELARQGKKLLDALKWHGVAMVEFKRSAKDGKFYLMEINPKFWGSLDLSIRAGMDFPFIAYNIAIGKGSEVVQKSYRRDAYFRWPFPGELLHALETRNFSGFISDFFRCKYADDVQLSDPAPLVLQLISTFRKVRSRTVGQ